MRTESRVEFQTLRKCSMKMGGCHTEDSYQVECKGLKYNLWIW